jgi:hypothetical protein
MAFVSQRWIGRLLILAAVGLAPWTIVLSFRLPAEHTSHHWDVAWVGFDVFLTVAVAATALGIHRRMLWARTSAAIAATLLLTDSWFDNLLASGMSEHLEAALETAVIELPLALACLWVAVNTVRAIDAVDVARGA